MAFKSKPWAARHGKIGLVYAILRNRKVYRMSRNLTPVDTNEFNNE